MTKCKCVKGSICHVISFIFLPLSGLVGYWSVQQEVDSCTFNSIQFNSIQLYLYSAITRQLSLGALQSPEPEPPKCKHNGNTGKKKLPVSQEGTLSRTTAHKGGP